MAVPARSLSLGNTKLHPVNEGIGSLTGKISIHSIIHDSDPECSVTLEDIYFPTSYDVGPANLVVPGKYYYSLVFYQTEESM